MRVVLVHGAWADGSGWRAVHDVLSQRGFDVALVQEPETSFADDVAATNRVLHESETPTILVGHSYGGSLISETGVYPTVVGLVYVAAHMPDIGEATRTQAANKPSVISQVPDSVHTSADGFTVLSESAFLEYFAPDAPVETARLMARSQVRVGPGVFTTPLTAAAWRTKPCWGVVAAHDQIISPDLERWYYARAGAETVEIEGASHAVYVSHPERVAQVIIDAASALAA